MIRRALAALVSLSLVLLAPGTGAYDVCARTLAAPARASRVPVGVALPTLRTGAPALRLGVPAAASTKRSAPTAPTLSAPGPTVPALSIAAPAATKWSAPAAPTAAAPTAAAAAAVPAADAAPNDTGASASIHAAAARESSPELAAAEGGRRFDLSVARRGSALASPSAVAAAESERAPEALAPASAQAPEPGKPEPAKPELPASGTRKLPRSLWGLFWGHHVMTVFGVNFHMVSQPFLVMNTLGMSAASLGLVRNVHMGGLALANVFPVGALIDNTDYRVVFAGTTIGRALLMGAIPLLFFAGSMPFTGLAVIVGLNAWFQNAMLVADAAATRAFLGRDEKIVKDGKAVLNKWDSVFGFAMPIAAGVGVGALVATVGAGGYALAYAAYAALLLASLPIYWRMVRDPRFPQNDKMGLGAFAWKTARFLASLILTAFKPFGSLWQAVRVMSRRGPKGPEKKAEGPAPKDAWERLAAKMDGSETTQGLAVILRSRVLRILTGVMALEVMLIDALPFIILPAVIAALGAFPASLPAFLATEGGILGLLFGIEYLGRLIPSMRLEGEKGDKLLERKGHGSFYRKAAIASLAFWALLIPLYLTSGMFWLNLAIVAGVLFGVQLFHGAIPIVIEPVKRPLMDDDKLAKIEQAILAVDVAFESVGAILLGLTLDLFGLRAAAIAVAAFFTLTAFVQYKVPKWIFPDGNHPAKPAPPTSPTPPAEPKP